MPRALKRVRRGKRKPKRASLKKTYGLMMRAISERVYRASTGTVLSTTSTQANVPIMMGLISQFWTPGDLNNILSDTGASSNALTYPYLYNSPSSSSWDIFNMKSKHSFRNCALNPTWIDIWVLTSTKRTSFQSSTNTGYDSLTEQVLADLYTGWQAKYLAGDMTAQLKQADSTTAWGGNTSPLYTSSMNFTPGMSDDFNLRWRIVKHHAAMLNPGQTLLFNDHPKDVKNYTGTVDTSTRLIGHAGTCRILLYRIRGSLGYYTTVQGYTNNTIVHSVDYSCKVGIRNNEVHKITATTAPTLPTTTQVVSGVGDDAIVV